MATSSFAGFWTGWWWGHCMLMQNRTLTSARPAMTAQGGFPTFAPRLSDDKVVPKLAVRLSTKEPRITSEPRYICGRARRTFEAGGDIHPLPEDIVVLEDVSGRDTDAEFDAVGDPTPRSDPPCRPRSRNAPRSISDGRGKGVKNPKSTQT